MSATCPKKIKKVDRPLLSTGSLDGFSRAELEGASPSASRRAPTSSVFSGDAAPPPPRSTSPTSLPSCCTEEPLPGMRIWSSAAAPKHLPVLAADLLHQDLTGAEAAGEQPTTHACSLLPIVRLLWRVRRPAPSPAELGQLPPLLLASLPSSSAACNRAATMASSSGMCSRAAETAPLKADRRPH